MRPTELAETALSIKNVTFNADDLWTTFEVIENGELGTQSPCQSDSTDEKHCISNSDASQLLPEIHPRRSQDFFLFLSIIILVFLNTNTSRHFNWLDTWWDHKINLRYQSSTRRHFLVLMLEGSSLHFEGSKAPKVFKHHYRRMDFLPAFIAGANFLISFWAFLLSYPVVVKEIQHDKQKVLLAGNVTVDAAVIRCAPQPLGYRPPQLFCIIVVALPGGLVLKCWSWTVLSPPAGIGHDFQILSH